MFHLADWGDGRVYSISQTPTGTALESALAHQNLILASVAAATLGGAMLAEQAGQRLIDQTRPPLRVWYAPPHKPGPLSIGTPPPRALPARTL